MNIKELAEQAGFTWSDPYDFWAAYEYEIERFAELVAEQTHTNNKAKWYQEGYEAGQRDEREACAKLCEEWGAFNNTAQDIAEAIRARSKHD